MDLQIALLLGQDGITNGAIYALLALALVLVFAVTRVIFIPQGEFVAFGALTLASLQAGRLPGTIWLLLAMGTLIAVIEVSRALRERQFRRIPLILLVNCGARCCSPAHSSRFRRRRCHCRCRCCWRCWWWCHSGR
jgi:branched-subunit amino acid ABC-type transport system permease component